MDAHARRSNGTSLVELLAAVAVLSVLMGAGALALKEVGAAMKLSAYANRLLSELYLARNEAIKRNGRVVLCKSLDGETCAGTGGWEQGWIVFHDVNNNAARDPGEALIRRGDALMASYRVSGNASVARYVSFSPYGGARLTSGAFQAGTITVCRQSLEPSEAHQLIINAVGRPRVKRVALPSCY